MHGICTCDGAASWHTYASALMHAPIRTACINGILQSTGRVAGLLQPRSTGTALALAIGILMLAESVCFLLIDFFCNRLLCFLLPPSPPSTSYEVTCCPFLILRLPSTPFSRPSSTSDRQFLQLYWPPSSGKAFLDCDWLRLARDWS